ncbi:MAG: OsmC family protein [Promethearchaeota archaeon]
MVDEFKAEATLIRRYQSVVTDTRGHAIVCDLPPEKGGYDQGTSALEFIPIALAECILTIFALKAMGEKVKMNDFFVKVKGFRPNGGSTLANFEGTVKIVSPADEATCQRLLDLTLESCPVGILLRKAGCNINIKLKHKSA